MKNYFIEIGQMMKSLHAVSKRKEFFLYSLAVKTIFLLILIGFFANPVISYGETVDGAITDFRLSVSERNYGTANSSIPVTGATLAFDQDLYPNFTLAGLEEKLKTMSWLLIVDRYSVDITVNVVETHSIINTPVVEKKYRFEMQKLLNGDSEVFYVTKYEWIDNNWLGNPVQADSQDDAAEKFVRFFGTPICNAKLIYDKESHHPNEIKISVDVRESGNFSILNNGAIPTQEVSISNLNIIADTTAPSRPSSASDFVITPGTNAIAASITFDDQTTVKSIIISDVTKGINVPVFDFSNEMMTEGSSQYFLPMINPNVYQKNKNNIPVTLTGKRTYRVEVKDYADRATYQDSAEVCVKSGQSCTPVQSIAVRDLNMRCYDCDGNLIACPDAGPNVNRRVRMEGSVRNTGAGNVGLNGATVVAKLQNISGASTIELGTVATTTSGASGNFQFDFDVPSSAGNYQVIVQADYSCQCDSVSNNAGWGFYVVEPQTGHNIVIPGFTLSKDSVAPGGSITLTALIKNEGAVLEPAVSVVLAIKDPSGNVVSATETLTNLATATGASQVQKTLQTSQTTGLWEASVTASVQLDNMCDVVTKVAKKSFYVGTVQTYNEYKFLQNAYVPNGTSVTINGYTITTVLTGSVKSKIRVQKGSYDSGVVSVAENDCALFDNNQLMIRIDDCADADNETWMSVFQASTGVFNISPSVLYAEAGSTATWTIYTDNQEIDPDDEFNIEYGPDVNTINAWQRNFDNFSSDSSDFNFNLQIPFNAVQKNYVFWARTYLPDEYLRRFELVVRAPHDLAVTNVTTADGLAQYREGGNVTIKADVNSPGGYDENDVTVTLTLTGPNNFSYTQKQTIALLANETKNVPFVINTTGIGGGNFIATVKVASSWTDRDTSNNTGSINLSITANTPPGASITLDPGTPAVIYPGDQVNLIGTGNDADDDALTNIWSFSSISACSSAVINSVNSTNAYFRPDLSGDYIIALRVSDGRVLSSPAYITVTVAMPVDTIAPVVAGVAASSPSNSRSIPVTITATDNEGGSGIVGYRVTESATQPDPADAGWSCAKPFIYTVPADGTYTLYGWAKDGAGNVSLAYTPVTVIVNTTSTAGAYPFPDTGQTKCHNEYGFEITCPSPGEAFYGQDAQYNLHPRSYTKLNASGNVLPDDATSWVMVKDNVTGLIWEMKTDDDSIHDKDKTFTWCDTNSATNGVNSGTCGAGTGDAATDTEAFINALNSANYGGHSDWRMPTIKELSTLVNSSIPDPGPTIDTAWFPDTSSDWWWSSTTCACCNGYVWGVGFYSGIVNGSSNSYGSVRAVRGGQASSNLVDNRDGTVTDSATGLMWQKDTASGTYTWEQALAYVATLNSTGFAGYTDWRLPDRNELQSLVDYSRYEPAIDPLLAADNMSSDWYWSSTNRAGKGQAWHVNFGHGYVHYNATLNNYYVRAARAGQSGSFGSLVISRSGSGTVTSDPSGINCGSTCSYSFPSGTSVVLTATPDPGATFTGWSGACSGTEVTCTVTMNGNQNVSADFTIVDNTAPTITSATSTTTDGSYTTGTAINITLNFSEAVSSTGLTITLNTGKIINTNDFSGASWSGTYTVEAGQTTGDLTITSVTGTITDASSNSTVNPTIPAGQNIGDGKAIVIPLNGVCGAANGGTFATAPTSDRCAYGTVTAFAGSGPWTWTCAEQNGGTPDYCEAQADSVLNAGLVAYYPFNGNANDESGTGNNGTVNGATPTTDRFGNANQALSFDGVSNYVSVPNSTSLETGAAGDITILAWIKTNTSQSSSFLSKYNSARAGGYLLSTDNATPRLDGRDRNGYRYVVADGVNIADDQWHLVAGMRQGSVWSIWVDGTMINSVDTGNTTSMSNPTVLVIGAGNDGGAVGSWFNGHIDDVRVYNRALSLAEVQALYNDGGSPTVPTITSATSTTSDGSYTTGAAINITLNFSEVVSSTGLTITLNTGKVINTGAFSGASWIGTYTVEAGQTTGDLTITSVTGTITDASSNSTTNPTIPAGQNIGDGKAIFIPLNGVCGTADGGTFATAPTSNLCSYGTASAVSGSWVWTCAGQNGGKTANCLGNYGAYQGIQLPQTGQTACYDESGAVISCAGTGQDGELQAGVAWPDPRFTDNGDQSVTDNLTGLVWTKDGNAPGPAVCSPATTKTWQGALDYVKCLNENNYLNHNDWRLPNVNELKSLTDVGEPFLAVWIKSQGFTNVQSNYYWSSNTRAYDASYAWVVYFYTGNVEYYNKMDNYYVWPVRGGQAISLSQTGQTTCYNESGTVIDCTGTGQDGELRSGLAWPDPRFADNSDQTVTDNLTGLVWTKDGHAPGPSACGPGATMTWQGALDYVKCLNTNNYLNHNDWCLPNVNELKSLTNAGVPDLATWLNSQGFTNVQSYYWSSSTSASYTGHAWRVSMGTGRVYYGYKTSNGYVWPVRGGQSRSFGSLIISRSGSGTVVSNPAGINCGSSCSASFVSGTSVVLTATPDSGATFTGWSGACSGTQTTCTVTMDTNKNVTANFTASSSVLYSKFANAGIWKYSGTGTDWTQITASNPQLLVTVGSTLYGTFPGLGIWKFNGTNWTQTTTSVPEIIVGTSSTLYGSFAGLGIWQWNGTQWSQTTTSIPQTIIASTSDLYGTFAGLGIWKFNGTTWNQLTTSIPDKLVTSGVKLYGTFANMGIWLWNGTEWKNATSSNPQLIAASSAKLYGSFAGAGIWEWDGAATWTKISADTPTQMVASGAELYAVFTGVGVKKWDGVTWSLISGSEPAGMVVGE